MPYRKLPKEEFLNPEDAKLITDRINLGNTRQENLDEMLARLKYEKKDENLFLRQGKTLSLAEKLTQPLMTLYANKERLFCNEPLEDRFVARYKAVPQAEFIVSGPYYGNLEKLTFDIDLIWKIKRKSDKLFSRRTRAIFSGYASAMGAGILLPMLTNAAIWLEVAAVSVPVAMAAVSLKYLRTPKKLYIDALALSTDAKNYSFGDEALQSINEEFNNSSIKSIIGEVIIK